MTVLSEKRLRQLIYATAPVADRLVVSPLLEPDQQIGEGSIDLRLGSHFIVTRTARVGGLNPFEKQDQLRAYQERLHVPYGKELWIHPGTFVLGATLEYLRLPVNIYAEVTTRSSWARLGLNIASAVAIHPGFVGCLTLELVNAGNTPIAIIPAMRIGQLTFFEVEEPSLEPATSKYQAQILPQYPLLEREAAELEKLRRLSS